MAAGAGPRASREARERRYRRAIRVALLASAVLHVLLLWSASSVRLRAVRYALPPVEIVPAPEGLVVVDVAPGEPGAEAEEPRPEPVSPEAAPPPEPDLEVVDLSETEVPGAPGDPSVDAPGGPPEEAEEPGMTNAERLTIRFSDARIWFNPRNPYLYGQRLARFARADSAVRAILRDWLDSLSLSEEERRRATDWTFEKDGERWGISPEGLHLGEITIPIPFGFAPTGPRRREFEQALRDLREIQLQNLRLELEEMAEERRREMRERSEEEARRRSGDTTSVRSRPSARRPGEGFARDPSSRSAGVRFARLARPLN